MEVKEVRKRINPIIPTVLIIVLLLSLWWIFPLKQDIGDENFIRLLYGNIQGFDNNYMSVESYTRVQENKGTNRIDKITATVKYEDAFLTVWFEMEGIYKYSRIDFKWGSCNIKMKKIVDSDTSRFIGTYVYETTGNALLEITGADKLCFTDDLLTTTYGYHAFNCGDYVMRIYYQGTKDICPENLFFQNKDYYFPLVKNRVGAGHYLLMIGNSFLRMYPDGSCMLNYSNIYGNAFEYEVYKAD